MYCGDSRYFAASCPRKLKAVSGHVEMNQFKENQRKNKEYKGKENEIEAKLGKV